MDYEQKSKQFKSEDYHIQVEIQQKATIVQSSQQQRLPPQFQSQDQIRNLSQCTISKLLKCQRIIGMENFKHCISVEIIETNFQSMRVSLHYGNYKMHVSVIFTEIDECLFAQFATEQGSFGAVRHFEHEMKSYAIKCIEINDNSKISEIYREYFMAFLASVLEVGSAIYSLFGYDIVVTKSFAFFVMQKCEDCKNTENIEKELLSSLKIINSIKFIHYDIKPSNIMYSPCLKKNVFIDFGLSSLILEDQKQKTRVRFAGTFAYCSEEMKKCYQLKTSRFISLYENDYCCFAKTIKKLAYVRQKKAQQQCLNEEIHFNRAKSLCSLVFILRLKYFLERKDIQNLANLIKKSVNVKKTIYQIFLLSSEQGNLKQIQENSAISAFISKLKNQVLDQQFTLNQEDEIMSEYFGEDSKNRLSSRIMPISEVVNLQLRQFQRFISNDEWALKLFIFIDPFQVKNGIFYIKDFDIKKRIIEKIYQFKAESTSFFGEKARFFASYFYTKLAKLKNLKILTSLRFLFIAMEDWLNLEIIDDQICQIISDNIMKVIKIIQFSQFWDLLLNDAIDHRKKKSWNQMVKQINFQQQNKLGKTLKQICLLLLAENDQYGIYNKQAFLMTEKLTQAYQFSKGTEYEQQLYNISCIFCAAHAEKMDILNINNTVISLPLRIYSQFLRTFQQQSHIKQIFEKFFMLFSPPRAKWKKQFILKAKNQYPDQSIELINCELRALNQNQYLLGHLFWQNITFSFMHKETLFYLIKKMQNVYRNSALNSEMKIYSRLIFKRYLLQFAAYNINVGKQSQRISQKQYFQIIHSIKNELQSMLQNQQAKSYFQNNVQIKLMALSIIITTQFINKNFNENILQTQIKNVMILLQPLPFKRPNFLCFVFLFFSFLQQNLHRKQYHFSQDILLHVGDTYLKHQNICLFQTQRWMLADMIRIKNYRNQYKEAQSTLLTYVEVLSLNNAFASNFSYIDTLVNAVTIFIETTPKNQLQLFYKQLCAEPYPQRDKLYQYVLFNIFLHIIDSQTLVHKISTLQKTGSHIQSLPYIIKNPTKAILLKTCRSLNLYRNARKSFICVRLERLAKVSRQSKQFSSKIILRVNKIGSNFIREMREIRVVKEKLFRRISAAES